MTNFMIHPQTKSILLNAPDPFLIRGLLSKSRTIHHPKFNIAVKHTLASARVLNNIGLRVPSPILGQYNWPGKYHPFKHQYRMAEFLTMHKRAFNLSEMGVGKSAAALWAADYLISIGAVRSVLILSPLSTIERVWLKDCFDVLMHRVAKTVHGSREQRMKTLKHKADFYIMNHDGVAITEIAEALRLNPRIDLIILDEASMFRNATTRKYKALLGMIRPDQRLWLMTGTPCPNAPTDAWALAKLVNPDKVPKFFGSFKRATMKQVSPFKWVPYSDAYKKAYDVMQPAVRFKKADCLDLPPVIISDRQAPLTPEQRTLYKEMRETMIAEIVTRGVSSITAVNAADKINKLRQILCGVIKNPTTGSYVQIDHGPRVDTLLDCIASASAKVYVIVPFKGIIHDLATHVGKHYSVAVLNGDVSAARRNKIIEDFKTTPDPHVLLCHPKVTAHGLNLTEADTAVFYAPIYSNDEYAQIIERFNRAGQTRKMTVLRMGAHPLEWQIYRAVDDKSLTQTSILELYRSITE